MVRGSDTPLGPLSGRHTPPEKPNGPRLRSRVASGGLLLCNRPQHVIWIHEPTWSANHTWAHSPCSSFEGTLSCRRPCICPISPGRPALTVRRRACHTRRDIRVSESKVFDGSTALNGLRTDLIVARDGNVARTIQACTMWPHARICTRRHRSSMRAPPMQARPLPVEM